MSKLIVAFCAAKHSGKDLCAEFLTRNRGFVHEKVAEPLKAVCSHLFGLDGGQVNGGGRDIEDPRWGRTPREILQFVGTEMFQHKLQELLPGVGRSFWARSLADRIRRGGADRVVVSDMRFQHELDTLRELTQYRVVVLRIERPGLAGGDSHPSEHEFERIAPVRVIHNDSDIDTLLRRVDDALGGPCGPPLTPPRCPIGF